MSNNTNLELTAYKIRKHAIDGVYSASSGHPGGSLSIADILSVLYFDEMNIDPKNPKDPSRDRFVLSLYMFSHTSQKQHRRYMPEKAGIAALEKHQS